jgi:hypothetical protein
MKADFADRAVCHTAAERLKIAFPRISVAILDKESGEREIIGEAYEKT